MNLKSMMPMVVMAVVIVTVGSGKLEPYYFLLATLCLSALVIWTARDAQLLPSAAAKALDFKSHKQKVEHEGEKAAAQKREEAQKEREARIGESHDEIREILNDTAFGQEDAVEQIAQHVTSHLVKPNPSKPLVISLMGPTGYRKEQLAKSINDVIGYLSNSYSQVAVRSALEDTSGYGDAVANASGVFILSNASKAKVGDLGHVLKGEKTRKDPHLIVVLIENTSVREILDIENADTDLVANLENSTLKNKLPNLNGLVDLGIFLSPMSDEDMGASLWKSASEAAEKEYQIKIHDPDEDNVDDIIRWLAKHARAANDGRDDPHKIQTQIVRDLMPALQEARINGWTEVSPSVRYETNEHDEEYPVVELLGFENQEHGYDYDEADYEYEDQPQQYQEA